MTVLRIVAALTIVAASAYVGTRTALKQRDAKTQKNSKQFTQGQSVEVLWNQQGGWRVATYVGRDEHGYYLCDYGDGRGCFPFVAATVRAIATREAVPFPVAYGVEISIFVGTEDDDRAQISNWKKATYRGMTEEGKIIVSMTQSLGFFIYERHNVSSQQQQKGSAA